MDDLRKLVDLLGSGQLVVATGLWLLPSAYVGHEEDEARRLDLKPVDLRARLLKILPEGTKVSGLSADRVVNLVDTVAQETGEDYAGAMVYNLDLLLSRLKYADQQIVWDDLFSALRHRPRGVLLTLPETAVNLLPSDDNLNKWQHEHRMVGTLRK